MKPAVLLALAASTLTIVPAPADIVTFSPVQDTGLADLTPLNNYGAAPNVIVGATAANQIGRMLLEFDIASTIPAGSQINSVTLRLVDVSGAGGMFTPSTFSLHRALVDWNGGTNLGNTATSGEATWDYRVFEVINWGAPGGTAGVDFQAAASAGITLSNIVGGPITQGTNFWGSTPEMVADVQNWLDDPGTNYGWFVISSLESSARTSRRFGTVNSPSAGSRPLLTVDFTPVPEPATMGLILTGVAGAVLVFARRRRD